MPCSDVTEEIRIIIDKDDNLISYDLKKRTCGRPPGAPAVVADEVCGRNIDYILVTDDDTLLGRKAETKQARKFIALKHLFALRSALAIYKGLEGDPRSEACAIATIGYDDGNVIIDADIKIEMITEKIEACPGCGHP